MTQRSGNIVSAILSALGGIVGTYGLQTDTGIAVGGGMVTVAAVIGWQWWKGRTSV